MAEEKMLGEFSLPKTSFGNLDTLCAPFSEKAFQRLNEQQKRDKVNRTLYEQIQKAEPPIFLLGAVVEYVAHIIKQDFLEYYSFGAFELWLNHFSGLAEEENMHVRGKIMGKIVPRDAYQSMFPIAMNKRHEGSHFVTAHRSPDLDTTVASFWGWVDAFTARVGSGLHVWNVPGGPPMNQVEIDLLFLQQFGQGIFDCITKKRQALTLSSLDLLSLQGVMQKRPEELAISLDHERQKSAVILVDHQGTYLGDWRHFDVDGVRQVIMSLNNCLRYLENHFHIGIISLFARPELKKENIQPFLEEMLNRKIQETEPVREFTHDQRQHLNDYLIKVLHVKSGIEATFQEFSQTMEEMSIVDFSRFINIIKELNSSEHFDDSGRIKDDRPSLFGLLENIVKVLSETFRSMRFYVERLEVALKIKSDVFGFKPRFLTHRTDIEEIRSKILSYPYLTVNLPDRGRYIPLGVIYAADLQKRVLGTVSLRDFCNREEITLPDYLEVISVVDHHKATLQTGSPPLAVIGDAQSSNALVAELAFEINDAYSLGGLDEKTIHQQIEELKSDLNDAAKVRIFQKLLQRRSLSERKLPYHIDSTREFLEYLHFVFAILDDTDLLTKVSTRDVEVMASLINRLKSLLLKKECEVIHFDDLNRDSSFLKAAAQRLLQNPDLYSLYSKVYAAKESSVDEQLLKCGEGETSTVFADTKVLNRLSRVGQTKIFAKNFKKFLEVAPSMHIHWLKEAKKFYEENSDTDLFIHMVSTIPSAEELHRGEAIQYEHQDELWFWMPETELAIEHLKLFLNAFQKSREAIEGNMHLELLGDNAELFQEIFNESFLAIPQEVNLPKEGPLPMAILHYKAGSINSRKGVIAPALPTIA